MPASKEDRKHSEKERRWAASLSLVLSVVIHVAAFAGVVGFVAGRFGPDDLSSPAELKTIEVGFIEEQEPSSKPVVEPLSQPESASKEVLEKRAEPKKKTEQEIQTPTPTRRTETKDSAPPAVSPITPASALSREVGHGIPIPQSYADLVTRQIARHKHYPFPARQRREEGKVVVLFEIGADGNLTFVRVETSSGSHILDHAALSSVQRAAPFPNPPQGNSPARMSVPLRYSLRGN
jgi:protein TonB